MGTLAARRSQSLDVDFPLRCSREEMVDEATSCGVLGSIGLQLGGNLANDRCQSEEAPSEEIIALGDACSKRSQRLSSQRGLRSKLRTISLQSSRKRRFLKLLKQERR